MSIAMCSKKKKEEEVVIDDDKMMAWCFNFVTLP